MGGRPRASSRCPLKLIPLSPSSVGKGVPEYHADRTYGVGHATSVNTTSSLAEPNPKLGKSLRTFGPSCLMCVVGNIAPQSVETPPPRADTPPPHPVLNLPRLGQDRPEVGATLVDATLKLDDPDDPAPNVAKPPQPAVEGALRTECAKQSKAEVARAS